MAPFVVPAEIARAERGRRLVEDQLREIDAEVRAHEHAHMAALGGGVVTYDTVVGPDGTSYAVGGGIPVNVSPVPGDPEATVRRARILIQAAYAAGQPSAADMRVAAEAYQMEMQAQHEVDRAETAGGSGARQPWFA
jgi:SprA-related family